MSENYWVVKNKYEFAAWGAEFPQGIMHEPREMLLFLQRVLEVAEREEIFRVIRAPYKTSKYDPKAQAHLLALDPKLEYRWQPGGLTYGQFLEQVLVETGKLIFFHQMERSPGTIPEYRVIAPARLSYYDIDGGLRDEEVEDIGELLRQVRPTQGDLPNYWPELSEEEILEEKKSIDKTYKSSCSAILFSGSMVSKDNEIDYGSYLFINLFTDIWFPKVGGFLEDQPVLYEDRVFYDNSELALRHTPRLNRFLANVRDITLEMGGTWHVDKDGYPTSRYEEQFNEDGIILDI
jgi:hypothetical protein